MNLQAPNFKIIPYVGAGKKLSKKVIVIGSRIIIKEICGNEHTLEIIEFDSNFYIGKTDSDVKIELKKENVFLIL
jgi:hypothetical protein